MSEKDERTLAAPGSPGRGSDVGGRSVGSTRRGWSFGERTIAALRAVLAARRDVRRYRPDPVPADAAPLRC